MTKKVGRVRLSDLSAVTLEDTSEIEVLGFLTWYSIENQLVGVKELHDMILESGLDECFMPPDIRDPDAFRRATKTIECKMDSPDGTVYRFLCREVLSDNEKVQRNIVKETVTKTGKLKYSTEEAVLVLNRKTGFISMSSMTDDGNNLAQQAVETFEKYKTHYEDTHIRNMCAKVMRSMSATAMRLSGGVYFVPVKYEQRLSSLMSFIKLLLRAEGHMIPLINTKENLEMVRKNTIRQVNEAFQKLKEASQNNDLTASDIKRIYDEVKLVIEDYKEILEGDLAQMERSVLSFQKMLRSLEDRIKRKSKKPRTRQLRIII